MKAANYPCSLLEQSFLREREQKMSMVNLPGLKDMIDSISRERNLPKHAVQAALREALMKGYERYRRHGVHLGGSAKSQGTMPEGV